VKEDSGGLILVVDDEADMRSVLEDFLQAEGYRTKGFSSADELLAQLDERGPLAEALQCQDVDLVLTDQNMPGLSGLDLLSRLKEKDPTLPVILITAFGSIERAVEATKRGAFDYVQKPFSLGEVLLTLQRAIRFRHLDRNYRELRQELRRSHSFQGLIGKSHQMRKVFDLMRKVADTRANVLICGESGTGKELVARGIHDLGSRGAAPFIALNCSAIPESLLESELFGHVRGSFTGAIQNKRGLFEEAEGGTLFLDEIGDMPVQLQAKLLRVIQERKVRPVGGNVARKVDVRLISATHLDLRQAIRRNQFREDLFYRLCVIPIQLSALRERREDIPLLAEHFLTRFRAENGSEVREFSRGAMRILMAHDWEGNVRELENLIERATVLCSGTRITEADLPAMNSPDPERLLQRAVSEGCTLAELEDRYIRMVLLHVAGHKEKAAHILGINRRTLYRKEREAQARARMGGNGAGGDGSDP